MSGSKSPTKTILKWVLFFDGPLCAALGVLAVQDPSTAKWGLTLAAFLGAIGTGAGVASHVRAGKDRARALRAVVDIQPGDTPP